MAVPPLSAEIRLLTAAFSLTGVIIAALLSRFARRPRRTFVRTTVALTVLSPLWTGGDGRPTSA
ncbi:DUF6069 family protein [Micromonospora chersina]|uniref:DUF6069 family protein n=1 Tax=Micromonospora chersina TaxID=47854 RepID=UPI0033EA258A